MLFVVAIETGSLQMGMCWCPSDNSQHCFCDYLSVMSLSEEASASSCLIDLYADTLFCSGLTSLRSIL